MVGSMSWSVLVLASAITLGLVALLAVGVAVFREGRPRKREP